ncbi:MAG TPA: hypothetical protein VFV41_17350 [Streptosporangiaceae bacterium]|nr:hypothetical protein [Streptosporangiaceae bacterium]
MTNATAVKATCPDWCEVSAGEHADDAQHIGKITLTADLWLLASQEPGQPVQAELFGREAITHEGGIALNAAELAMLASTAGRLAG